MSINWCACMGPMRGDPYCPCEMKRRNLQQTPMSEGEIKELNRFLNEIRSSVLEEDLKRKNLGN